MDARQIVVNGVSLHVETFGDPAAPALLLIMGAMASGTWWPRPFCEQLAARRFHVIRYDHRDTGQSTCWEPGAATYGFEDLALDAVGILDGLAIARAHLAGMSLGGMLAQLIALTLPERVRTLTLIATEPLDAPDPAVPPMDPEVLAWHAKGAALDWSDRMAVIDYQVGAWRLLTGSGHAFLAEDVRALAAEDYDRTPSPRSAFNHARLAGANLDRWMGRLHEIRAPALVIHGTEDRVCPYAHALALQQRLPRARLLSLVGTGHELHRADWPAIVDAIAAHAGER